MPVDDADAFACWGVYSKGCTTRRMLARIPDDSALAVSHTTSGAEQLA